MKHLVPILFALATGFCAQATSPASPVLGSNAVALGETPVLGRSRTGASTRVDGDTSGPILNDGLNPPGDFAGAITAPAPIPFSEIGAKATVEYQGDALGISATSEGARLYTGFQKLAGRVTREGLWLESTADGGGSLHLTAVAIGREGDLDRSTFSILPSEGSVLVGEKLVTFTRPGLHEEYSVSVDGLRQDFIVVARPAGEGELRVELGVSGAVVEARDYGAKLTLDGSNRVLAYSRLRVTDSTGRELAARIEVSDPSRLAVVVGDESATYPVRIDPTFSDADWVSISPGIPGANDYVTSSVMDGSGNLYIAGNFTLVGAVAANRIAKWNGSEWSALGTGLTGGEVLALTVSGTDVYAGGWFTTAGGVSVAYIAKWNGTAWSALGTGMGGVVRSLASDGTDVFAGGDFTTAGGVSANRIAKWNGSAWSALGTGMPSSVRALAASGSDLYAGGDFTTAGGVTVNRIARWNGSEWSALDTGMNESVRAIALTGTDLYAGGVFTTAGGVTVNRVAKWNGTAWSALGTGMNSHVFALAVKGSEIFAGGDFTTAGGITAVRIAKWNGFGWSALISDGLGTLFAPSGPDFDGAVRALAVSGTDLIVGGQFSRMAFTGGSYRGVARWNGSAWSIIGPAINGQVHALLVSGTDIYVGGNFSSAGNAPAQRVAKWNGSGWSSVGTGVNGTVWALAMIGTELYAGGGFSFRNPSSELISYLAKSNGSQWSPVIAAGAPAAPVLALAVFDSSLYVGGSFQFAAGVTVNGIFKVDGSAISAVGTGLGSTFGSGTVYAMAVRGSDLFVGGSFTTAGGGGANNIAKWDGSAWSALGTGVGSTVQALAVMGEDLYAGGGFTTAGGAAASLVAKWNGIGWSALGAGVNHTTSSARTVNALAVSGTDLYAGGLFNQAGGASANSIAKWNGSSWSSLGTGIDTGGASTTVDALAVDANGQLLVGGLFTYAGTTTLSPNLVRANVASGVADIAVSQDGPVSDGGTVDLGAVPVGGGGAPITFTITNPGTAELNSLSVGGGTSEFAVGALSGTSIPVGVGTVTFTVTFIPEATGPRTATLQIANNVSGAKNPYEIVLTGTGVAANVPPVAGADQMDRPNNTQVAKVLASVLLSNDHDDDLDPLTIIAVGNAQPAGAAVEIVGNFVIYTAPTPTAGDGSFEYTLSDGPGGHAVTGTVVVTETSTSGGGGGIPNALGIAASGDDFVVTFLGMPNGGYRVQYTISLAAPFIWEEFVPPAVYIAAPNGVFIHTDLSPPGPLRLYRAVGNP